jgi:hypothetical protein
MATTQYVIESTFANTMDTNIEPTSLEVVLPYRSSLKDDSDQKYATQLRKNFYNLELETLNEFDKFTQNLMQEEYISRNCLLDAINDFYRIHFEICSGSMAWCRFTDNAFNYRPYQMW